MSSSGIIDFIGNGKIFNSLLPNPYPYPAQPPSLAQVLIAGDDAGNGNIENLLQLQVTNVVQQAEIGGHLTIGGTPLNPGSGGTLRIQGATAKGSLLVGDGVDTAELVCPTTNVNNLQTETIYNWNTLSNGQSKTYAVPDGSTFQPGYSITITYSGTDFVTGTITAVVGNDITMTITAKGSQAYVNGPLIDTTPPDPSAIAGSLTNPVFTLNPATTTPSPPELPQFSMITGGFCFLYSVNGNPNPVPFNIEILGTNIERPVSALANTPLFQNPPTTPTAYAFPDGCFVRDTQIVQIKANTSNTPVDFGFPTGGTFVTPDYCGTISGYLVPYGGGTIEINSKLVLTADPLQPLGVFWGVDAQGVGSVTSVTGGNNITMSGSLSAPVVNLSSPLTSNLAIGGTAITSSSGGNNLVITSGSVQMSNPAALTTTTITPTTNQIQYFNSSPASSGLFAATASSGSASYLVGGSVGGDSCILRTEIGASTGAVLDLETIGGANKNFTIKSEGALRLTSAYNTIQNELIVGVGANGTTITGQGFTSTQGPSVANTLQAGLNLLSASVRNEFNAGSTTGNANPNIFTTSGAGGASFPIMLMENTNATGSVALEVYKNKPTAGANGDVLYTQSVFGKDSGNTKQEYTRITHTIRDATAGAEDGSLELGCFVNGGFANFIQLNANDAPIGEVNFTRPLDFIGGSDANSTIKTSGVGSVNLNLDATASAGAGGIVLKTKNTTGSIAITGDQITTTTAGGNTGRHLRIFLPNASGVLTPYKINLFADT